MTTLSDLFPVFERLEAGESVALGVGALDPGFRPEPPEANGPFLGVRSSGSSGIPKTVWRPWSRLRTEVRVDPRTRGWRWASPFRPDSFAGVQAALQAWAGGGTIDSIGSDWDAVWAAHRVRPWDAFSATPTYMDLLVQNERDGQSTADGRSRDPLQITLGGEVLRPGCGARLRERFPNARFTVVFASAEWGVLLKTHRTDGWYELASLERRYPEWRLTDGVLEIRRSDGAWSPTGDLVERDGDLLRVIGRSDRVANVAGTKVNLDEIGRLAETVPGVRRALAVAEASAVTGQVIALRYAPDAATSADALETRLADELRGRLPKPAWPRRWIRDELLPGTNAKRAIG